MEGEYRMKVNLTPILHICAQSHLKRVKKKILYFIIIYFPMSLALLSLSSIVMHEVLSKLLLIPALLNV